MLMGALEALLHVFFCCFFWSWFRGCNFGGFGCAWVSKSSSKFLRKYILLVILSNRFRLRVLDRLGMDLCCLLEAQTLKKHGKYNDFGRFCVFRLDASWGRFWDDFGSRMKPQIHPKIIENQFWEESFFDFDFASSF